MTALELADTLLSKETRLTNDHLCEAVSTLRRQHEAIKQLRDALRGMVALDCEGLRGNDDIDICYEHREALHALKDTEDLA